MHTDQFNEKKHVLSCNGIDGLYLHTNTKNEKVPLEIRPVSVLPKKSLLGLQFYSPCFGLLNGDVCLG